MPQHEQPGEYLEDDFMSGTIVGVSTSTAAFIGQTERGPTQPSPVTCAQAFEETFGGSNGTQAYLADAVRGFFANGGLRAVVCRIASADAESVQATLAALETNEQISLIAAPGVTEPAILNPIIDHCERLRFRFAVLDCAQDAEVATLNPRAQLAQTSYAAVYFPWIVVPVGGASGQRTIPPSGHVLGVYARTDAQRGVWKAPANEPLHGVVGLAQQITMREQELLSPRGVNAIRSFEGRGNRVWGARTLSPGAEWKYVNIRRLFIFLERSLFEGIHWASLEPNDEQLWTRVRDAIAQFLANLWLQGAFVGSTARDAFWVKCDRSTMTEEDISEGRLICAIGVAPIRPAEFIVFRIVQQTSSAG